MTPPSQEQTPCTNSLCSNTVAQKPKGRPRLYCSDECGRRHRRYLRHQPALDGTDNDQYALQLAEHAYLTLGQVVDLTGKTDEPLAAARLLEEAIASLEFLRAALMQQAHDRKLKTSDITAALHISPDTVTRRRKDAIDRRERLTRTPLSERMAHPVLNVSVPHPRRAASRHPDPSPPRSEPMGGAPGKPSTPVPPASTPASTLAMALSHLQRRHASTFAVLGEAAGVSRSYISRILSGERTPSWQVTSDIVEACGGDLEAVRPLWEAARGYRVPRPATFHAALRGMQLAAGNIRPDELSARTGHTLSEHQVTGLLQGTQTADWGTVSTLVTALRGQPEAIHPLWQATQPAPATGNRSFKTSSLSAESFG
ncbi:helix-turn-helix domain-containing protein [Streptomyces hydrogenans]